MATVREITTLFNFKPNLGGLKKANISIDKLKKGLKVIGVGALAAGGALFAIAKSTANFGDNIAKTAQKIGLSTDALQELAFASKLSGVEQVTLEGGIKRLSRGMLEASQGVATYADTYKDLGISVEDGNGELKSADVILGEVADSLSVMEDGTEKTAIAQELFGRAGAELIPLLNAGSKGISKMRKEARSLGIVMSSKATKASEKFNDELLRTTEVVLSLKRDIGIALLPIIQKVSTAFRKWVSANRELIRGKLIKFFEILAFSLGFIAGVLFGVIKLISKFVEALKNGETGARALALVLAGLIATKGLAKFVGLIQGLATALKVIGKSPAILLTFAAVSGVAFLIGEETKLAEASIEELGKRIKAIQDLPQISDPSIIRSRKMDIERLQKQRQELLNNKGVPKTVGSLTPSSVAAPSSQQASIGDTKISIGKIETIVNGVGDPRKVAEMVKEQTSESIRKTLRGSPHLVNTGS